MTKHEADVIGGLNMTDIELIIKIPEEMYKWVYDVNKFSNDYGMGDFIDLIKNGTTLDTLRAEIADMPKLYPFIDHIDTYVKEDDVLALIDKYRNEERSDKA